MHLSKFKSDIDLEKEGVRHDFDEDAYIRVARAGNPNFTRELKKLTTILRKRGRRTKLDDEVLDEAICRAMARTILTEMVGFKDHEGDFGEIDVVIEDTEDNRFTILTHKEYKDFRDMVSSLATDYKNFAVEDEEEDEKKSEPSSDMPSPGAGTKSSSTDSKKEK